MKRFTLFASLCVALFAVSAVAGDDMGYQLADGKYAGVLTGECITMNKAAAETTYILGGPTLGDGDFQTGGGAPSADGWTSVDFTAHTDYNWHVDNYNCANLDTGQPDNHAWWCGTTFVDDCGTGDYNGYGNGWNEYLDWRGAVGDPLTGVTVRLSGILNNSNEPGYDYLYAQYEDASGMQLIRSYNGEMMSVVVNEVFTLTTGDYTGPGSDEVHLRFNFVSDSGWSDADCLYPSTGAAQIDLISVEFDQGGGYVLQGTVEDCDTNPIQWYVDFPLGVGDFSHVWPTLGNIDPCRTNSTPLFAFIDDGVVVAGTGGYLCTTWCYGYGGYIVNPEGGMAGPDFHVHNEIWSPVLTWPGTMYDGAQYVWDVFRHEDLSAVAPGIFYWWHVRSTDGSMPITDAGWQDRNFVYYGGPDWLRTGDTCTDLMMPGRTEVQLALGVIEYGWVWGWTGTDGYPAPYFDNVGFLCFEFGGPGISTREIDIANDGFPEIGQVDYVNLGQNHVRFDMARNISLAAHLRNDPGDSIFCDVVPVRTGAVLNDMPKLYYKIDPGTSPDMFAGFRSIPLQGWIYGDTTYTGVGTPIGDRYNFDLPDSSSLFPGDKMHYYVEGQDNVGGNIGTTLLPSDTTGFDNFFGYPYYSSSFTVRALPSIKSQTPGDHPPILFWNDFANRGGESEWHYALSNLGFWEGLDYDTYYTNGPSSGVGDGLGGRATATVLSGYETMLYTCGDLSAFTIANGDFTNDPSNDVGVLDSWLQQGGKNMFMTGDDLVFDLNVNGGAATLLFENTWIMADFIAQDLRPLIHNQPAPTVVPLPGPITFSAPQWIAYGGCLVFNTFDAVEPEGTSLPIAEFIANGGIYHGLCLPGIYPYAAGLYNYNVTYNNTVVYLPYDFMYIYTGGCLPIPHPGPLAARTLILQDVLAGFGHVGPNPAVGVPGLGDVLTVKNFPNPFNPKTTIEYNMPRPGHLAIRIFNLQGRLVRTLIDEPVPVGSRTVEWPGDDDRGRAVSSGVYFCETRALGETIVKKMAIVR